MCCDQLLGDRVRAHLGLVVVGRDVARRRHEHAVLAGEGLLEPAVEEERDVRVLLGLRDAELREPARGEQLAEDAARAARDGNATGSPNVASYSVMHTKRRELRRRAAARALREALLARAGERVRELARAVGAEVEEEHHVAVGERRAAGDHARLDELVGLRRARRRRRPRRARRARARPRRARSRRRRAATRSQRLSRSIAQ